MPKLFKISELAVHTSFLSLIDLTLFRFMPPRLSSQGFSSFIAFYACSRPQTGRSTRGYSIYRWQCLQNQSHTSGSAKRIGDKVSILHITCVCFYLTLVLSVHYMRLLLLALL